MKFALLLAAAAAATAQPPPRAPQPAVPVTPENFPRAESDLHFAAPSRTAGLGKFVHRRDPVALDHQGVTRMNRDTLYSAAVFDLAAGPVTITLPDAGKRFLSMQIVDEDANTVKVVYGPGPTHPDQGRRSARATPLRRFAFLSTPAIRRTSRPSARCRTRSRSISRAAPARFTVPNWDATSQVDVRTGLMVLAETLPDAKGLSGRAAAVDPVRRLIGAGAAWGGLPQKDALFVNVRPGPQRRPDRLSPDAEGRAGRRLLVGQRVRRRRPFRGQPAEGLLRSIRVTAQPGPTARSSSSLAAATATSPIASRRRPTGAISSAFTGPAPTSSTAPGLFRSPFPLRKERSWPK